MIPSIIATRRLRIFCCTIAVLFAHATVEAGAAEQRPNIVFIMSDDHAYQAISAYGSTRNNDATHRPHRGGGHAISTAAT